MKAKVKILYTIPNFDTAGSGRVVYDLVKHLDRSYFSPEICVFHTRGDFFEQIKSLNVPIHVFRFQTPYKPYVTLIFRIYKIFKFFKKHRFDIIHSWHWSSDFTEPLAAKLAGIPFVYTKKAMGWGNKAWRWRTKLSTKIVAINEDMIHLYFSNYSHKTIQLPLGIDTDQFKPMERSRPLMESLGLSKNDFIIVSVANLVDVKGIEILLNAVDLLKDPIIKVIIVGADHSPYALKLKDKYKADHIKFLGQKNDVKPYLSIAHLFVIPTKDEGRKEGMPIAPLEAMAMGVPVIGSRISGIKDILSSFPERLFIPSDSIDLSEKIKTFKANYASFNDNKMITIVKEKYDIKKTITSREKLYKEILNR